VAPDPLPSTSVTTAPSTAPSPPTTTSAEATTTATPVPSATTRARAESDLTLALLDTYAFNAGVHVVTTPTNGAGQSSSGGGAGTKITSDNPKCAPFLLEANAAGKGGTPGVTGYANVTFQGDGDPGPFLVEEITTVGTAEHVADVLAALNDSFQGCTKLTISAGKKSSTLTVSPAPPPPYGDHPIAVHIVGSSGPLKGFHPTVVTTGVKDAVITMTFFDESDSDIKDITQGAVERATDVFAKPT